jgi:hypothetical protein
MLIDFSLEAVKNHVKENGHAQVSVENLWLLSILKTLKDYQENSEYRPYEPSLLVYKGPKETK